MFDFESGVERVLRIFSNEGTEEVWPHASVQVLADLQGDLDFFREGRRDVLSDLILRRIEGRVGRKADGAGCGGTLDLNTCSEQCFAECGFCKLCRGWHSDRCGLGMDAYGQAAREGDQDGTIRICDGIWGREGWFASCRRAA